jgi:hypothetical protein
MAKKAVGDIKLVRKHRETGDISPRKRGRPSPDFEVGYLDAGGDFKAGDPPKRRGGKRRGGRPKGSKNKVRATAAKVNGRGLNEIESIVRREVETRLKNAKLAALRAFDKALGV